MKIDSETLDAIIKRIVKVAAPEKIILFGSAAKGNMNPDSDIDLLVIKSNIHRRKLAQEIYKNLFGIAQSVDIVVATPEDVERYKNSFSLVIAPAVQEGKVIYVR